MESFTWTCDSGVRIVAPERLEPEVPGVLGRHGVRAIHDDSNDAIIIVDEQTFINSRLCKKKTAKY